MNDKNYLILSKSGSIQFKIWFIWGIPRGLGTLTVKSKIVKKFPALRGVLRVL